MVAIDMDGMRFWNLWFLGHYRIPITLWVPILFLMVKFDDLHSNHDHPKFPTRFPKKSTKPFPH